MFNRRFNLYIVDALITFAERKMLEITTLCEEYYLSEKETNEIQVSYINALNKIDFLTSYARRNIVNIREGHDLKSINKDNPEILPDSLEPFLQVKNPALVTIQDFVCKHPHVETKLNHSESILSKLRRIKEAINLYSGTNKKNMIADFNIKMQTYLTHVKNNEYTINLSDVMQTVNSLLDNLQEKENKYYTGMLFFSGKRKAHSTFQTRINAARSIAQSIVANESQRETLAII
jgi:hypothetical protein